MAGTDLSGVGAMPGSAWRPARGAVLAGLMLALALALLAPRVALAGAEAGIGSGEAIAPAKTTVGFWAGEAVPGTDWDVPATYWNRRDTHFYTPRLWRVLRRNHVPLYFNLRYRRDFGPVPAGSPSATTR